jgi:hypothetical protein
MLKSSKVESIEGQMASMTLLPLYDEFLNLVVEKVTPEAILAFKASPEAQAEAQELLERNSAGTLTPDEEYRLKEMANFERMMALLKSKALVALRQK